MKQEPWSLALLELGYRLKARQGPLPWSRNAGRLLLVCKLLSGHLGDLSLGVGTEFSREDHSILVDISASTEALEELIGEQPVLAGIVTMRLLDGAIAHHPHESVFW